VWGCGRIVDWKGRVGVSLLFGGNGWIVDGDVRVVVDVELEEVEEGIGYEVDCAVDVWV